MVFVGEKIWVAAVFKNGAILPRKFVWNGKELTINRIDLSYSKRIGNSLIRFFSVEVLGRTYVYQISFNTMSMIWQLEAVNEGN